MPGASRSRPVARVRVSGVLVTTGATALALSLLAAAFVLWIRVYALPRGLVPPVTAFDILFLLLLPALALGAVGLISMGWGIVEAARSLELISAAGSRVSEYAQAEKARTAAEAERGRRFLALEARVEDGFGQLQALQEEAAQTIRQHARIKRAIEKGIEEHSRLRAEVEAGLARLRAVEAEQVRRERPS